MASRNRSMASILLIVVIAGLLALMLTFHSPTINELVLSHMGIFLWTGLLQYGIDTADHPVYKARYYALLEDWEKRVEIDEKHKFFSKRLNTGSDFLSGEEEFMHFIEGIDALSNNGEPEKAIQYLAQFSPTTGGESEEIEMLLDFMNDHRDLMNIQKKYVQLATDILEEYEFAEDVTNPHVYVCYFSFFVVGQVILLWRAIIIKSKKTWIWGQSFFLLFSSIAYGSYLGSTQLTRLLSFEIPIYDLSKSIILNNVERAHRPSNSLERARQIFLKYPFQYDDLLVHVPMHLMSQVMHRELSKCNHPIVSMHEPESLVSCKSAHKIVQTIALMMEANESQDYIYLLDFWYDRIELILQAEVSPYIDQLSARQNYSTRIMSDPENLRTVIDDWIHQVEDEFHVAVEHYQTEL
jgi:hypothetical protein